MATTTKDIGKYFYWLTINYNYKPAELWEKAETQEIDGKYRNGVGIAIRMPFSSKAVVIGYWRTSYSESQALTVAINGRGMRQEEVDWDYIRDYSMEGDS